MLMNVRIRIEYDEGEFIWVRRIIPFSFSKKMYMGNISKNNVSKEYIFYLNYDMIMTQVKLLYVFLL